jgi:hypothetical protein
MRYFDKEKYKKLQPNPKYSGQGHYLDTNGDEIRITASLTDISEEITKKDSPITNYYVYHANFIQKATGQEFYRFPIGISKEYDTSGNTIKETNHDLPFKFTIEQVCELIKKEYDVDLMKKPDFETSRVLYDCYRFESKEVNKNDFRPVYEVSIRVKWDGKWPPKKIITIDGTTGKILYEKQYSAGSPRFNELPKAKSYVEVRKEEKKSKVLGYTGDDENTTPLGYNQDEGDNNSGNSSSNNYLLLVLLLLIAMAVVVVVYIKQKEDAELDRVHLVQ